MVLIIAFATAGHKSENNLAKKPKGIKKFIWVEKPKGLGHCREKPNLDELWVIGSVYE